SSRTAYLVVPVGLDGIDCSLEDGQMIDWHGWNIQVIATPGHARDHVAFAARKKDGPLLVFCGDALASPGKLGAPDTTDWDPRAGARPEAARRAAPQAGRREAGRAPPRPRRADHEGGRRRPGADRRRRRRGRLPQELRALHQAAPRQRPRLPLPGEGAGRVE